MVHKWSTRDSHEDFCHKSTVFKRNADRFFLHPLWQTFLINVLLDEQHWRNNEGSSIAPRLPRLRMPEMPVASAGRHTVRAIGVPGNISGNRQSSAGSAGGL